MYEHAHQTHHCCHHSCVWLLLLLLQLESAAVLARALPEKTLPVLTALTREQTQQLRNGAVAGATAAAAVGGAGAGAGAGAAGATGGQLALQCVNEVSRVARATGGGSVGTNTAPQRMYNVPRPLQRLFWLVWFSGFVLTDAAEGEVPCIPAAMNAASTRASRAASGGHKFGATVEAAVTADPVVQLVTALLQLLELESQWMQARAQVGGDGACVVGWMSLFLTHMSTYPQDENLSPLVCTKLMWFLDRWCRSYLMPDISNYRTTAVSPTLTRCYAATAATAAGSAAAAGGASPVAKSPYIGGGDAVLNFVLQKATLVLAKFATEQDMCEAAVDVLKVRPPPWLPAPDFNPRRPLRSRLALHTGCSLEQRCTWRGCNERHVGGSVPSTCCHGGRVRACWRQPWSTRWHHNPAMYGVASALCVACRMPRSPRSPNPTADLQMALTSVIVGATRSLAFDADAMPGRAGDISSDRAAVEAAAKAAAQSRQMTYYKAVSVVNELICSRPFATALSDVDFACPHVLAPRQVVTPIQTKLRQLFELPAFKSAPFPAAAQQPATLQEVERIIKVCGSCTKTQQ